MPPQENLPHSRPARPDGHAAALFDRIGEALSRAVEGEVRFDRGSRALYSTDASNYRQVPIGVVIPKTEADVLAALDVCRKFKAPVVPRGGGTSLAGQCCNTAVVFDFSKYMNRIVSLDAQAKQAVVQPGVVLDQLRDAAEKHGLTFGPDPATHNHCTLGGMLGNNSCGIHSVMAGKTSDNVTALDGVTYDGTRLALDALDGAAAGAAGRAGELARAVQSFAARYEDDIRTGFPQLERRVSGYNLPALLPENGRHLGRAIVGSEGTLVTILNATVRLVDSPRKRTLVVLGYPDIYTAGDHVLEIRAAGPIGLEAIDQFLVNDMTKKGMLSANRALLPPGGGWLLVEFGGDTREESDAKARKLMERLRHRRDAPAMKLFDDPHEEKLVWKVRESGLGATARVPGQPDTWEGWEDSAVPPAHLGRYLRELKQLYRKYGYRGSLYGHFGQGCVHTRINFDLETAPGIRHWRAFLDEAAELVVSLGGSLSGEHGDGQSRAELLPKMFSPALMRAFGEFKAIWDPDNRMNPGKVVHPFQITENLRLGRDYAPMNPSTHFAFPEDDHSFDRAVLRCVGVGECRRHEGGTMCPSYRATREEMHSTRGRARLLFEMLQHEELRDGWQQESVKESLDLCLACKGCKGECPIEVDMATYKAEFLSHYFEGHLRPLSAYAFGYIAWWSRLASLAPWLANGAAKAPGLSAAMKHAIGVAGERSLPHFANVTFREWHRREASTRTDGEPVMLWPDTFNNHFHPDTAAAAYEVLTAAGFRVTLPRRRLCCGRPLYDFGMLDTARRWLGDILETLRPAIRAGVPLVVLEPSCWAVFKDELVNLMPHDMDARRLHEQTYLFAEFFEHRGITLPLRPNGEHALVHGHCHQKALKGMGAEDRLFSQIYSDHRILDSGCCGMAGAFGFAAEKYDVSVAVAESALLPELRSAGRSAIVADGFSCREQIRQLTDRRAVHTAEAVRDAMPAARHASLENRRVPPRKWAPAAALAAAGAAGVFYRRQQQREAESHATT